MNSKSSFCKYLWASKWVSILAYVCGADFVFMIIISFADRELAETPILIKIFVVSWILFLLLELYSYEIFEKLDLEEDYYLNKSLILYREHKKLCTKQT